MKGVRFPRCAHAGMKHSKRNAEVVDMAQHLQSYRRACLCAYVLKIIEWDQFKRTPAGTPAQRLPAPQWPSSWPEQPAGAP